MLKLGLDAETKMRPIFIPPLLLCYYLFALVAASPPIHIHPISTGANKACAILQDRSVVCWGQVDLRTVDPPYRGDGLGEMGDNLPVVDLGATTSNMPLTIIQGASANCALFTSQQVKCWGSAGQLSAVDYGTLGYGDTLNRFDDDPGAMGTNLPFVDLGTGVTVQQIAMEGWHVCALMTDGRVKCWGLNQDGQLGLGDTGNRGFGPRQMGDNLPYVDLGPGVKATRIACGEHHSCVILESGDVKCWGLNTYGQLGYEDNLQRGARRGTMGTNLSTIDLGTGNTAIDVDVAGRYEFSGGRFGYGHTCVVLATHLVKCWGKNTFGELGLEDTANRGHAPNTMGNNLPAVDLSFGEEIAQIKISYGLSCALSRNTKLIKCWGNGFSSGALGQGDNGVDRGAAPNSMGGALPPIDLGTGITAQFINVGHDFVCALLEGSANTKCWGLNSNGQLGLGDAVNRGDDTGEMGNNLPLVDLGVGRTVYNGPTPAPTASPSRSPTPPTLPTVFPTPAPTADPTREPTPLPSTQPTRSPVPTLQPTTAAPTPTPDRTSTYLALSATGVVLLILSCVACAYLSPTSAPVRPA